MDYCPRFRGNDKGENPKVVVLGLNIAEGPAGGNKEYRIAQPQVSNKEY